MFVTQKKLVCGERKNYWKMNIVGIYGETYKKPTAIHNLEGYL